jgi:hypothetical protein
MNQLLGRKQFIRTVLPLTGVITNFDGFLVLLNFQQSNTDPKKKIDPYLKKLILSQTFAAAQVDPVKTLNSYYALSELYRLSIDGQFQNTPAAREEALKQAGEIVQKNKTLDRENFEDIAIMLGGTSVAYDAQMAQDQYWIGKLSNVGKLGMGLMTAGGSVPGVLLGVAGVFSDDALKYTLTTGDGRGSLFSTNTNGNLAALNSIAYNKILTNAEKNPLFNTLLKSGGLNEILKMAVEDDGTINVDHLPENIKALISKTANKDLANVNTNSQDLNQTLKDFLQIAQGQLDQANSTADRVLKEIEKIKNAEQIRLRQQEAAVEMQKMYREVEGMVQIGAFVLDKIFKNPGLANGFSKTFETGSKVFSLINQFQLGQIGSLALTGGMLSAGVAFASVLGGGPSFEQQVMQQLEGIDKKLDYIINLLDERFNRIERTQEEILKQLSVVLKEVREGNIIALNNFVVEKSRLDYIKLLITEIDRFNHELTLKQETENFISLSTLHPKLIEAIKIDYHRHLNYFYVYSIDTSRSLPNSGFEPSLTETDPKFTTKLSTAINDKDQIQYFFGLLPLIAKVYDLQIPFPIVESPSIPNPIEWARGANLYMDAKITYSEYLTDQTNRELVKIWDTGSLIRKICIFFSSPRVLSRIANIYLDKKDGLITNGYPEMVRFVLNVLNKWGAEKLKSFKPASVFLYGFGQGVLQEGRLLDKNVYFQFVKLDPRTAGVLYDNDPLEHCIQREIVELQEVKPLTCDSLYDWQINHAFKVTQRLCSIKILKGKFKGKIIGGENDGLVETSFSLLWTPPGEEAKFGTKGKFRQYKWTLSQPLVFEVDNLKTGNKLTAFTIRPNTDGMQDILDLLITEYREKEEYDLFRQNFTDYLKHEFDLALNDVTRFENNATIVRALTAIAHWTLSNDSSIYESDIRNIPLLSSTDEILDFSNGRLTNNFNLSKSSIRNYQDFYMEILNKENDFAKVIRSKLTQPVLDGINKVVRREVKDSQELRKSLIDNLNITINNESLWKSEYSNLFESPDEIRHLQYTCTDNDDHIVNRLLMDKTFTEIQQKIRIKEYTRRHMVDYYNPINPWASGFCESLNDEFYRGYNFILEYRKLRDARNGLKGPVVIDESLAKIGSYLYWKNIPFSTEIPAGLQKELEIDITYNLTNTFLEIKEKSLNRFEDIKRDMVMLRGPEVLNDGSNFVYRSSLLLPITLKKGMFAEESPLTGQVSEYKPTLMYFMNSITGHKQFAPVNMVSSMALEYNLEIKDKTIERMATAFNEIVNLFKNLIPSDYIQKNYMPGSIYQFMEREKYFERGDNTRAWSVLEPDALLCEIICFTGNTEYPKIVEVPNSFKALDVSPFANMNVGDLKIRFVIKNRLPTN